MWENTRKYIIRNKYISTWLRLTSIDDKMRENRLRQFGYVRMRHISAPVRKCKSIEAMTKKKDRSKLRSTWIQVI